MLDDRFYCTFRWEYNPLFIINIDELEKEIVSKLPTLKGKDFKVYFPANFGFKRS